MRGRATVISHCGRGNRARPFPFIAHCEVCLMRFRRRPRESVTRKLGRYCYGCGVFVWWTQQAVVDTYGGMVALYCDDCKQVFVVPLD